MQHDLQKPLPFPESSFQVVYHSHLLEHLPRSQAPLFLRECYRVLRPGGILRIVVPDLQQIARLYLQYFDEALAGNNEAEKRHHWMTLELLDQLARDQTGGEMLRYWQQQPMPAEDFVIQRMGQEVRPFLENARGSKNDDSNANGAGPMDPLTIGRFRESGEVHKWMYDQVSLRKLFHEAGFENIRVCAANESRIPSFNNYHLDIMPDGTMRKPDSLFMEAEKPRGVA